MRRCLTCAIVLLLGVATAAAQQTVPSCPYPHAARPDSKAAFTEASILALAYARSAWEEGPAFEAEQRTIDNPISLLTAMMRHTKSASEAYTCAELIVAPYRKSVDQEMTGFTADFVATVYAQHRKLNDQFLDVLRKLSSANDPGQLADALSTLEVERGKLWTDLTKATGLAAMGLMDRKRTNAEGNLNALVITRAEKRALLNQLVDKFPELKNPSQGDLPTPTRLAGLYYTFLMRNLKCSDE
jgi:hypothetical protein